MALTMFFFELFPMLRNATAAAVATALGRGSNSGPELPSASKQ